jgi:hypothetical protein
MFLNSEPAVTAILSWLRDTGILVAIMVFGWKARGIFQAVEDFTDSIREHMMKMEAFAARMEANHLRHIEQYLYRIARDRNQVALVSPEAVAAEDIQPPEDDSHAV